MADTWLSSRLKGRRRWQWGWRYQYSQVEAWCRTRASSGRRGDGRRCWWAGRTLCHTWKQRKASGECAVPVTMEWWGPCYSYSLTSVVKHFMSIGSGLLSITGCSDWNTKNESCGIYRTVGMVGAIRCSKNSRKAPTEGGDKDVRRYWGGSGWAQE